MLPSYINWHLAAHPTMTAQDMVKLIFQAHCGCGHLLGNEDDVVAMIEREESALTPNATEPLTEPLGDRYCRLNLRRAMAEGLKPLWIARMMQLSAKPTSDSADRKSAFEEIVAFSKTEVGFKLAELHTIARRLVDDPTWLPGHSEAYRAAYAPAYRVISRDLERLLPILSAVAGKLSSKPQVLLCLDGPCGSGKTTIARQLVQITGAACVSMDDFYTPHPQKTPERLAQPGGNADIKRLLSEFLLPWRKHGSGSYRPYLCAEDRFGEPILVPNQPLTILEGSYSLHPSIAALADIRVFLMIDEAEQIERLLGREGADGLVSFQQRWIPLERAYHAAFSLPDEQCITISTQP